MRLQDGGCVVFRVDASLTIGTGHVMRCLALASALRERGGAACRFVTRANPGHLVDAIRARGFECALLPPETVSPSTTPSATAHDAWLGWDMPTDVARTSKELPVSGLDWLVVDHYALDARWEKAMRRHARRILVIDDLADREHDCDLLLDANAGRDASDYATLIPSEARVLVGPMHALLRQEFGDWRERGLARRAAAQMRQLMVSMGGVDDANVTGKVLAALRRCDLSSVARIRVVLGAAAPWQAAVRAQAAEMPYSTEVLIGVDHMAQLMCESDLAIGAAGGTALERCCVGLPSLLVVVAENQVAAAHALDAAGAAMLLGRPEDVTPRLCPAMDQLQQEGVLSGIARRCSGLTDGRGVARVVAAMVAFDA